MVKSIKFISSHQRDDAVVTVTQNMAVLYPIFPTVVVILKSVVDSISNGVRDHVFTSIRALLSHDSHIVMVPTNMAFAVRLLGLDTEDECDRLLAKVHAASQSMVVKRDVVLAMGRRRADHWLSDLLKKPSALSAWEMRAMLAASFVLTDEGQHWRKRIRRQLSHVDAQYVRWLGAKNDGGPWEIPL